VGAWASKIGGTPCTRQGDGGATRGLPSGYISERIKGDGLKACRIILSGGEDAKVLWGVDAERLASHQGAARWGSR